MYFRYSVIIPLWKRAAVGSSFKWTWIPITQGKVSWNWHSVSVWRRRFLKAYDMSNLLIWITVKVLPVNQLQIWCVNSKVNNQLKKIDISGYIYKQGHLIKIQYNVLCITDVRVHHGDCRNAHIIWHRFRSKQIHNKLANNRKISKNRLSTATSFSCVRHFLP